MPGVLTHLHYRSFDVSTLKAAYRMWVGDLPSLADEKKPHRAMADVLASIEECRTMRHFFMDTKEGGWGARLEAAKVRDVVAGKAAFLEAARKNDANEIERTVADWCEGKATEIPARNTEGIPLDRLPRNTF